MAQDSAAQITSYLSRIHLRYDYVTSRKEVSCLPLYIWKSYLVLCFKTHEILWKTAS